MGVCGSCLSFIIILKVGIECVLFEEVLGVIEVE